ncbi:radical SAM protein, partial [bacterium]|nr:radical SAM protein [bacterium]
MDERRINYMFVKRFRERIRNSEAIELRRAGEEWYVSYGDERLVVRNGRIESVEAVPEERIDAAFNVTQWGQRRMKLAQVLSVDSQPVDQPVLPREQQLMVVERLAERAKAIVTRHPEWPDTLEIVVIGSYDPQELRARAESDIDIAIRWKPASDEELLATALLAQTIINVVAPEFQEAAGEVESVEYFLNIPGLDDPRFTAFPMGTDLLSWDPRAALKEETVEVGTGAVGIAGQQQVAGTGQMGVAEIQVVEETMANVTNPDVARLPLPEQMRERAARFSNDVEVVVVDLEALNARGDREFVFEDNPNVIYLAREATLADLEHGLVESLARTGGVDYRGEQSTAELIHDMAYRDEQRFVAVQTETALYRADGDVRFYKLDELTHVKGRLYRDKSTGRFVGKIAFDTESKALVERLAVTPVQLGLPQPLSRPVIGDVEKEQVVADLSRGRPARELLTEMEEHKEASGNTYKAITSLYDIRDPITLPHVERMKDIAIILGHRMGLSSAELSVLELMAAAHELTRRSLDNGLNSKINDWRKANGFSHYDESFARAVMEDTALFGDLCSYIGEDYTPKQIMRSIRIEVQHANPLTEVFDEPVETFRSIAPEIARSLSQPVVELFENVILYHHNMLGLPRSTPHYENVRLLLNILVVADAIEKSNNHVCGAMYYGRQQETLQETLSFLETKVAKGQILPEVFTVAEELILGQDPGLVQTILEARESTEDILPAYDTQFVADRLAKSPVRRATVLLIQPKDPQQQAPASRWHYGLMLLASALRDKPYLYQYYHTEGNRHPEFAFENPDAYPSFNVHIVDLQVEDPDFDLEAYVRELQPDIVGVTTVTQFINMAIDISDMVERVAPDAKRVIGGVHASALPQNVMKNSSFEYVVQGEGIETFTDLVMKFAFFNQPDVSSVEGIWYKDREGTIKLSAPRMQIMNVDQYPLATASLGLLNLQDYDQQRQEAGVTGPIAFVMSAYGCPFDCLFCAEAPVFQRRRVKARSPENIMREIRDLYNQGYRIFYFGDDTFTYHKKRAIAIGELIRDMVNEANAPYLREIEQLRANGGGSATLENQATIEELEAKIESNRITLCVMTRVDAVDEPVLQVMKDAGVASMAFGVETGDKELLAVVDKQMELDKVYRAAELCHKVGIHSHFYMMTGLPGQNWASIKKSLDMLLEAQPDSINTSMAVPYPGSRLYAEGKIHMYGQETGDFSHYQHDSHANALGKRGERIPCLTYTDVMSPEEIYLARNLLFEAYRERNNPKVFNFLMQTLRRRIEEETVGLTPAQRRKSAVKDIKAMERMLGYESAQIRRLLSQMAKIKYHETTVLAEARNKLRSFATPYKLRDFALGIINPFSSWARSLNLRKVVAICLILGLLTFTFQHRIENFTQFISALSPETFNLVHLPIMIYGSLVTIDIFGHILTALFYKAPKSNNFYPKVTIITPAFNEGESVRNTILRMFGTGYPMDRVHVIAVNDGSQDDTLQYIEEAAKTYPDYVTVINFTENCGKRTGMWSAILVADAIRRARERKICTQEEVEASITEVTDKMRGAVKFAAVDAVAKTLSQELAKIVEENRDTSERRQKKAPVQLVVPEGMAEYFVPPRELPEDAVGLDAPVAMFVDSDSYLYPNAIFEIVQGLHDPNVGAVTGLAKVHNYDENNITALQALIYFVAFGIAKAGESVAGTVSCCSGCLSAYNMDYLVECVLNPDDFVNERYRGVRRHSGDDRKVTNLMLKRGFKTLYNENAVVETIVPNTLRKYLKQQLRWKKSWIMETGFASRFMWKKPFYRSIIYYIGVLRVLLGPLMVPYYFAVYFLSGDPASLNYFLSLFILPLARLVYYAYKRPEHVTKKIVLSGILAVFLYTFIMQPLTYYAAATLKNTNWGTRVGKVKLTDTVHASRRTVDRIRQALNRLKGLNRRPILATVVAVVMGLSFVAFRWQYKEGLDAGEEDRPMALAAAQAEIMPTLSEVSSPVIIVTPSVHEVTPTPTSPVVSPTVVPTEEGYSDVSIPDAQTIVGIPEGNAQAYYALPAPLIDVPVNLPVANRIVNPEVYLSHPLAETGLGRLKEEDLVFARYYVVDEAGVIYSTPAMGGVPFGVVTAQPHIDEETQIATYRINPQITLPGNYNIVLEIEGQFFKSRRFTVSETSLSSWGSIMTQAYNYRSTSQYSNIPRENIRIIDYATGRVMRVIEDMPHTLLPEGNAIAGVFYFNQMYNTWSLALRPDSPFALPDSERATMEQLLMEQAPWMLAMQVPDGEMTGTVYQEEGPPERRTAISYDLSNPRVIYGGTSSQDFSTPVTAGYVGSMATASRIFAEHDNEGMAIASAQAAIRAWEFLEHHPEASLFVNTAMSSSDRMRDIDERMLAAVQLLELYYYQPEIIQDAADAEGYNFNHEDLVAFILSNIDDLNGPTRYERENVDTIALSHIALFSDDFVSRYGLGDARVRAREMLLERGDELLRLASQDSFGAAVDYDAWSRGSNKSRLDKARLLLVIDEIYLLETGREEYDSRYLNAALNLWNSVVEGSNIYGIQFVTGYGVFHPHDVLFYPSNGNVSSEEQTWGWVVSGPSVIQDDTGIPGRYEAYHDHAIEGSPWEINELGIEMQNSAVVFANVFDEIIRRRTETLGLSDTAQTMNRVARTGVRVDESQPRARYRKATRYTSSRKAPKPWEQGWALTSEAQEQRQDAKFGEPVSDVFPPNTFSLSKHFSLRSSSNSLTEDGAPTTDRFSVAEKVYDVNDMETIESELQELATVTPKHPSINVTFTIRGPT